MIEAKKFYKMSEYAESDKIVIFTNHLKIDGTLSSCNKCKELSDCILPLENAIVCKLEDYCTCDESGCECNDYVCFRYDKLAVNTKKIISFSFLKQ